VEGINDTLINSQESVITDYGNNSAQVQLVKLVDSQGAPKVAQKDVMGVQPKRRSECLKKDIHLTTMEKNEAYAKKRALEGNIDTSHSLSDIDNVHLNDLAKNMGVVIHDDNFSTFDILKDLEAARNCLFNKHQKKSIDDSACDSVVFDPEKAIILIDDSEGDDMEFENLLLQKSKMKNKSNKKKFIFSLGGGSKTRKILAC
jgi:hypothetical protein